jgi:hypothetical protein
MFMNGWWLGDRSFHQARSLLCFPVTADTRQFHVSSLLLRFPETRRILTCLFQRLLYCIISGSVQGHPNGASGPAIHPRWPPYGVTTSKQFGFSCWACTTELEHHHYHSTTSNLQSIATSIEDSTEQEKMTRK